MKNRIVIVLVSFVIAATACKKKDSEPAPTQTIIFGPDVTIEKITNTSQLIEGNNDTVFFKVKLSRPFQGVKDATMARVLFYYGDTTAINGSDLFVFDQTGLINPQYDYYWENSPGKPLENYYSVNFYAGDSVRIVGIKSKENSVYEKDKIYSFKVDKVYYPVFGSVYEDGYQNKNVLVTYNYMDNDPMPIIGLDHGINTSITVQEANGMAQSARIKLTNRSGFLIPVHYSISGSATNGQDYIIKSSNPFIITPGSYYYDLNFDVINDAITEGTESFTIKLLSADNALIGTPANNSIFLRDSIQVFITE